jgi:hypothetical protein
LRDPALIATYPLGEREACFECSIRRNRAKFADHLIKRLLERALGAPFQNDAAQPPARESSTLSISPDIRRTLSCIMAMTAIAPADCSERIAQIVSENGNELLAQLGDFALGPEIFESRGFEHPDAIRLFFRLPAFSHGFDDQRFKMVVQSLQLFARSVCRRTRFDELPLITAPIDGPEYCQTGE